MRTKPEPFFVFNDKWALGNDPYQWIIFRHSSHHWVPVSFIASTKAVLLRVLHEKGVQPTPQAAAALAALPDTFAEFIANPTRYATGSTSEPQGSAGAS